MYQQKQQIQKPKQPLPSEPEFTGAGEEPLKDSVKPVQQPYDEKKQQDPQSLNVPTSYSQEWPQLQQQKQKSPYAQELQQQKWQEKPEKQYQEIEKKFQELSTTTPMPRSIGGGQQQQQHEKLPRLPEEESSSSEEYLNEKKPNGGAKWEEISPSIKKNEQSKQPLLKQQNKEFSSIKNQ